MHDADSFLDLVSSKLNFSKYWRHQLTKHTISYWFTIVAKEKYTFLWDHEMPNCWILEVRKDLLDHGTIEISNWVCAWLSCVWLCNRMDCSLLGSSVRGIFQARILEWVAISFSRASFQLRNPAHISWIGIQILYCWPTREALKLMIEVQYLF